MNLQDQNLIGVINPEKDSVESEFPVQKCKGNHGMAIDSNLHLAFIGCEVNSALVVYDLDLHKTISKFDIPLGVDGVAYDSKLKRVYAACDSGAIAILQVEDATHFHKLADYKIQDKVHSLAVNLENHKIFFPEEEDNGKPASKLVILDAVIDKSSDEKKLEDE